jgi:hypothetical protein
MSSRKKIIKWVLYSFLGLFVLLILLAIIIPIFFKDDIKAKIDAEIAKSVDADVNYDINKFSLSIFRNFPNISISQDDLSVVGRDEFKGDTLVAVKRFRVVLDIWSVIFGSQIKIRKVSLENPRIYAKVLPNGKANWDIAIEQPEDTTKPKPDEPPTEETEFNIGINRWSITDGKIVYDDAAQKVFLSLENLNHTGKGNFTQDVFDLVTDTKIENMDLQYDGISYLADESLDFNLTLNIDNPNAKYTFKENTLKINDFAFGFDGFVDMKDTSKVKMDLTYQARETEFKNILSLVPGVFTKDFDKIKTSGKLAFNGAVKGDYPYSGEKIPAFNLKLNVKDGMFQYPDLPKAITNIQMDLAVDNKDGVINNTNINLSKFHIDFGKNPVDAKAKVEKLVNSNIDAQAKVQLNLSDLMQMFPMPGNTLKGNFGLNLKAKGVYNETQMPTVSADMSLANGYLKTNQYPDALENMSLAMNVKNASGKYEDTKVNLQQFKMILDKEAFEAKGFVENFADVTYNFFVKGTINLGKIMHLYPIEGTTLSGKIFADLQTQGKMSLITAEQYDKLPTSGFVKINNLNYVEKTLLPQGFKITESKATFSPQTIQLEKFDGFLGKSDVHATGQIGNYMGYIFKPNAVLTGNLDFNSNRFDVNEWMEVPTSSPTSPTTSSPPVTQTSSGGGSSSSSTSMVVEIPKNIDFVLNSSIKEVLYDTYKIANLIGTILVKDGIVKMDGVKFNLWGGSFSTSGSYNTQDLSKPKYTFNFGIDELPLSNTMKALFAGDKDAKWTQTVSGILKSKFNIAGDLGQDLMPLFNQSMNGSLNLNVLQGYLQSPPFLSKISSMTKLSLDNLNLKDILVVGEIKDGKVTYNPFDIKTNDYTMNVSGFNTVDGKMDFLMKLLVPSGKIGSVAKLTLASLTGKDFSTNENVQLNFKMTGDYKSPQVNLVGSDGHIVKSVKEEVKDNVKEKVTEKKEEIKQEVKEKVNEKAQEALQQAQKHADELKRKAKEQADQIRQQADERYQQAIDEAAKKGAIAKKIAEPVAKKGKDEAYKKASQLETEADNKANKMMEEAQKKADALK